MGRRLTRLDVREISLVSQPANRRRFLIVKADADEGGKKIMSIREDAKKYIGSIRAALNRGEVGDADEELDNFETFLMDEALADDAEKARRTPEDEEEYGYAEPYGERPKRKPKERALRKMEALAEGLVQKSAFTEQPLTREQAFDRVVHDHPELYSDYLAEKADALR